jgi:hypothetical protein
MLPPGGAVSSTISTSSRCDILDTAGSVVSSTTFDYGPNPKMGGIIPDAWSHLKVLTKYITDIDPSTEYTGKFTTQGGRIQSACVFELPSMTQNAGGYFGQNLTSQSSMLDVYRENLVVANNNLWREGGAHVLNWTTETGSVSRTSSSSVNLIDTSVTTIDGSSPGYTLDMTKKGRGSRSVPCVMKVYGNANPSGGGAVTLKDSSGATVASVTPWVPSTPAWQSVTFNLPAAVDKYDLHLNGNGTAALNIYAVSIYEDDV